MHINWLGQTCVKLQTKNLKDEDVVILIDAYRPSVGDFPRSFTPQIALYSQGEDDAATLSQDPFILQTLGEVELKDTMIYSLPGPDETIVFKILSEGLTIVHLGRTNHKLNTETIAKLGNPDILFVPVGGEKNGTLEAEDAAATVTALEPRIVIPMAYQCDTDPKAALISEFIKNLGLKPEATDKKFIIKKKDLPQEETRLMILEKNY
ncbi:MAG: MBL fold metallo-hydrolase [Candidatus Magasanikbacteria bacterium]|nr:MBL fold metallo-hydrolase [Candidatus Magasanikbacteria bacterium]